MTSFTAPWSIGLIEDDFVFGPSGRVMSYLNPTMGPIRLMILTYRIATIDFSAAESAEIEAV